MSMSVRSLASFLFLSALLPSLGLAYTSNDYYQAGLSFYQQRDYAKAVQYLKAAKRMDPRNWQAEQVLGYCYYMTGDNADALEAFDASLRANPSNPQLQSFADNLRAKAAVGSAPVTSATGPPPGSETASSPGAAALKPSSVEIPFIFQRGRWANFHLGVIDAGLGDLQKGADTVKKDYSPSIWTASNSGLGFFAGGEAGISFDPENAIGLAVNLGLFGGYSDSGDSFGNTFSDSFSPLMIALEPLYHRFFLMGNSRLRLEAGPGFYLASLQANEISNGQVILSGPLVGYGFGGCLGMGWDVALGNFSLNIAAHGRLASTSNLQGQFQDSQTGNTYEVGLAMDANNFLTPWLSSDIGTGGYRWAKVDFTGFDLGLGLSYLY